MSEKCHHDRDLAAVAILTAYYAIHHGLALTPEDRAAIACGDEVPSAATWASAVRLLGEASETSQPTHVRLRGLTHALRWLGLASEDEFVERYGVSAAQALSHDIGRSLRVARHIEDASYVVLDQVSAAVTNVWVVRAHWLLSLGPAAGAAAVEALEAAAQHCPPGDCWRERIAAALRHARSVAGSGGVATAVATAAEEPAGAVLMHPNLVAPVVVARYLATLWCRSRPESERNLWRLNAEAEADQHEPHGPALWDAVERTKSGPAFELPVLLNSFRAWSPQVPGIPSGRALLGLGAASNRALAGVLRGCITETREAGLWADLVTGTDAVWSRRPVLEEISASARQVALSALVGRRAALQAGWAPVEGERPDPWIERHEGAQRRDTLERVTLIDRIWDVAMDAAAWDPSLEMGVAVDRAADLYARGRDGDEWEQLVRAARIGNDLGSKGTRGYPWAAPLVHSFALYSWQFGDTEEASEAYRQLSETDDSTARKMLGRIEALKEHAQRAAALEAAWERDPGGAVEIAVDLLLSHNAAGHSRRARMLAIEIVLQNPKEPLLWFASAWLLVADGRYRSAVDPLRAAYGCGYARPEGANLVRRLVAGLGERPLAVEGVSELLDVSGALS